MFTYAFMKLLEGRPKSYDRIMDRASRGRVRAIKEAVAARFDEGEEVLEIGCGTGELAAMIVARGARVTGLDASDAMVEAARARIEREALEGRFEILAFGVEGMDTLAEGRFDAAVSTLAFSELSDDERRFALAQAARALRPGGRLVIADEVLPRRAAGRALQGLLRAPAVALTFLLPGDVSRPLTALPEELARAGFVDVEERRSDGDSFAVVTGRRPA